MKVAKMWNGAKKGSGWPQEWMQVEHVEDGEQEKVSSGILEGLNLKLRLTAKSSQQHSIILRV